MNWFCYPVYGERGKPVYDVAEQQDVTDLQALGLKERLLADLPDGEANQFFTILESSRQGK